MRLQDHPSGEYRFLTGIAPYSSGVVASPGYEIVHATLQKPRPYRSGFALIERHLLEQKRKREALCAIELRLPAPLSVQGFGQFNQAYVALLKEWDLFVGDINPIARTNVAPEFTAPDEPSLYAFSYTMPVGQELPRSTFVVAGAGEIGEGALSEKAIIRAGETSADALEEKAMFVMGLIRKRLDGLGAAWSDVTVVDIYTRHTALLSVVGTLLKDRGQTAIHGAHWFYSRPPIIDLEFEMDVRGVRHEIRVD